MRTSSADLLIKNAKIITCDSKNPRAEAMALRGERIIDVGRLSDLEGLISAATRQIDGRGKTLVPGFIDAHCHIHSEISRRLSLDLSPAYIKSIMELRAALKSRAADLPPGTWIRGEGYNEFYLSEEQHPTRIDLDQAAPDHPTILIHRSRHACVLNSLALKIVGIDNFSEEPAGGIIDRDLEMGLPNGVLFEMLDYVLERIPEKHSQTELERGLEQLNGHYLSNGITSLGDTTVTNDLERWQSFREIKAAGRLQSRINMMAGMGALAEFKRAGLTTGRGDPNLKVGSLKIVLSAASGRLHPDQDELNQIVLEADKAGFQAAIHAVERSTVEAAATALEYCEKERSKTKNKGEGPRYRIEHCSECPPELRIRLSRLGAVIVSQPPFIYYSGERYLAQVPAEAQAWLYPFKSMIDSGLTLAGSSDSPVVPDNPLVGIYAAVNRRAESGQSVLPAEAVTLKQALEMYTINAAFASHEENLKGSLSPGKLADIVMLSQDPFEVVPEELKNVSVEMTIIGGKVAWRRESG